jgi:hypothetical protein
VLPEHLAQTKAIVFDSIGRLIAPANKSHYGKWVILQNPSLSEAQNYCIYRVTIQLMTNAVPVCDPAVGLQRKKFTLFAVT